MLDIYTLGEEVLREQSEPVTKFDDALRILVDAMADALDEADGVGLAAPQVGVQKRIFLVDTRKGDGLHVFINPEILETSLDQGAYEEGCLSIPGVYHDVIRPLGVTIQAQDIHGKAFVVKADGLLARAIQHEYDHLNGVLFIDHLSEEDRTQVIKAYEKRQKVRRRH